VIRGWLDAIRRNHALEHATVAVLLARSGPQRLAGRASVDGFVIVGEVETDALDAAAREALERLQRGQAGLAVSPLCGTNIVVTAALAALGATLMLAFGHGSQRLPNAFMAAMACAVAGQPGGRIVQRHLTTLTDHAEVEIVGTRSLLGRMHKVETRRSGAATAGE
jgi:hypothetical protein